MTEEEKVQFLRNGQNILTSVAIHARQLKEWSEAFEQRGGGAVLGSDATEIVYLCNDLQTMLDASDGAKRATIARLRTDY